MSRFQRRVLIREYNSGVSHCPNSNFSLKSGVCDVRKMKNKGVKVSFIHMIGNSRFEPALGGSSTQLNINKFGPGVQFRRSNLSSKPWFHKPVFIPFFNIRFLMTKKFRSAAYHQKTYY